MSTETLPDILEQLAKHLRVSGLPGLPRAWFQTAASEHLAAADPAVSADAISDVATMSFEELERLALGCTKCRLHESRCKVVFGVGKRSSPRIVFVGEGPGADEDRVGEPFVGRAGQLLTAAITKGLGMRREEVYICNVVKCRPPRNRTPLPDEVSACLPYLFRQLELLRPEVIVTLGAPAQRALTGDRGGITKLRGRWMEWRGTKLMPTFHPAYILRNPAAKRPFWEDLQEVMRVLGIEPPSKASVGDEDLAK